MLPNWFLRILALVLATIPISALIAKETLAPSDTGPSARSTAKKTAKSTASKVRTFYGIDWHSSLESAQQAAAAREEKAGKPVFWLRMLGDLNGFS